jgi:hypothetical protein
MNSSIVEQIKSFIILLTPLVLAYLAYKQAVTKAKMDDTHRLVNGSLGATLDTGLTSAMALAAAKPTEENLRKASVAQQAVDAHNQAQQIVDKGKG